MKFYWGNIDGQLIAYSVDSNVWGCPQTTGQVHNVLFTGDICVD